eukprot:TRINITY_DN11116_c0_g3_i1.p1 TRINITY_DN11116_c0_g3~~TRINITY_DN11116_c0_g3_i1.p1  ORF type:complete len:632 (+),score=114.85 TRINITY_DN11116_c0_g3_i1:120-2015(+)
MAQQPAEQKLHGDHKRYQPGRVWLLRHMLQQPYSALRWQFHAGVIHFQKAVQLAGCPEDFQVAHVGLLGRADPTTSLRRFGQRICFHWTRLFKKKEILDALLLEPRPTASLPAGYQNPAWEKLTVAQQAKVKEWIKELHDHPELDLVVKLHQHREPSWRPAQFKSAANCHKLLLDVHAIVSGNAPLDQSPATQLAQASPATSAPKQANSGIQQDDITTTLPPSSPALSAAIRTHPRTASTDRSSSAAEIAIPLESDNDESRDYSSPTVLCPQSSSMDLTHSSETIAQSTASSGGHDELSTTIAGKLKPGSISGQKTTTSRPGASCPLSTLTATPNQPVLPASTTTHTTTASSTTRSTPLLSASPSLSSLPPPFQLGEPKASTRHSSQLLQQASAALKSTPGHLSSKRASHASNSEPASDPKASSTANLTSTATRPTVPSGEPATTPQSGQPKVKRSKLTPEQAKTYLQARIKFDGWVAQAPEKHRETVEQSLGALQMGYLHRRSVTPSILRKAEILTKMCIQQQHISVVWELLAQALTKTVGVIGKGRRKRRLHPCAELTALERVRNINDTVRDVPAEYQDDMRDALCRLACSIGSGAKEEAEWEDAGKYLSLAIRKQDKDMWQALRDLFR